MNIIKRDGSIVPFEKDKIITAINCAFLEVDGVLYEDDTAKDIADEIYNYFMTLESIPTVEEVQDMVEDALMTSERRDVAKAYVRYRFKREMVRESNTTDQTIKEMLEGTSSYWNDENSNKNAKVVTTQRDYLAGITSTDIAKRFLLPKDVLDAHNKGIIHEHDMDYMAQNALHNCFRGDTKFISKDGVRPFCSYKDGEQVFVPTHTGEWKKAVVKKYGVQKLDLITLKRGPWTEKQFYVTENHRWLLKDGSTTTSLKIGDYLISTPVISDFEWEDLELYQKQLWCKGFAYGDGVCRNFVNSDYTTIRLCGKKNKYVSYFEDAGYKITYPSSQNYDPSIKIPNFNKNVIPQMDNPEDFAVFTHGYLSADGHHTNCVGASSKNEFRGVQVTGKQKNKEIYDLLNKSGYYVSSQNDITNQDTNYGKRSDVTILYRFQSNQSYRNWKVINIEKNVQECEVWCLEVEDNHSFILEGGVVTGNCCLINLEDMLTNGTMINKVKIDPQHRISTAATVATQIITAVASSQYGGTTISLTHLAPFVRMSYNNHYNKYKNRGFEPDDCVKYAKEDLKTEVKDAVQTFNYQINSMSTTNGQAPFLSVFMYINETEEYRAELAMLIEEFLNQRILGMKNEKGVYITPAFPKLLYVLDENNIDPNSEYYYLTELSAKCTAKRMVPDYISAKVMRELKKRPNGESQVYGCMGCRSFLTPDRTGKNYAKALNYDETKGKYYGRFNCGVTTINLVDAALSANGNLDDFWKLLDERCELCHKGLQVRIKRLEQATSDVAPILWQDGALARLDKGESLYNLIHHGYSTASLGFAGLWECVLALKGKKLIEPEGEELGLKIMQFLNDKCAKWKAEEDIDYSVYGTPLESTTYKFATCLQERFGVIEGITDKNYITNSYHIHVTEPIDAFNKLAIESKFQKLAPGGAISYIEVPNMSKNIPAVLELIRFIYDNIMYAEMNTKSDYCMKCGFDGEIEIKKDKYSDRLYWECPNCGNRDQNMMSVVRRTCGYLGSNYWNQGRTQEIAERQLHL